MKCLFLAALVIIGGCSTESTLKPCTLIPDGGCPLSHGQACADPACAAAYACTADGWLLDHTCPLHDSGLVDSSGSTDAGARDVDIDVPGANGGPGCSSLIPPDCALGTGAACPSGCCGCEDLFVCKNGGWSVWGYCSDGGLFAK